MGTKSVRLDEDVYERVKSRKRPDETMSEAIERLISGGSFLDLRETFSEDAVGDARAAVDETNRRSRADVEELLGDPNE